MPAFVLSFSLAFGFFMYVMPQGTGLVPKVILSAGLSAAGTLVFVIIAPRLAMSKLL